MLIGGQRFSRYCTLMMATALFAETLENSQHSTQLFFYRIRDFFGRCGNEAEVPRDYFLLHSVDAGII
jgi:hypothetical protein